MKFSEDFNQYAKDVLHIQDPIKILPKNRLNRPLFTLNDSSTLLDIKVPQQLNEVSREEWINLRDRYIAERIFKELGYEILIKTSYFKHYFDAIPCEGASRQCNIDCYIKRKCRYAK